MDAKTTHKTRALILDMDGVLWRSTQPIGDLPAVFDKIRGLNLAFTLATNNATLSAIQYVEKLQKFGVNIDPYQVVNSAQATAHYLKGRFPDGGNVFMIGEQGLANALVAQGFHPGEENVIAVVAAMDRGLTYDKLKTATSLIRTGVPFIGTNPDRTFPSPQGLVPGAGSILAALEAATDVQPLIIGKPQPEMYRVALERMQMEPHETLVVGDRLETDIEGAQKIGCMTGLVLSGVTSKEAAMAWLPQPDFIEPDLTRLLEKL